MVRFSPDKAAPKISQFCSISAKMHFYKLRNRRNSIKQAFQLAPLITSITYGVAGNMHLENTINISEKNVFVQMCTYGGTSINIFSGTGLMSF
jgi:hypothetical protein